MKDNRLYNLLRSGFVRSTLMLMSGSMLAQLLAVCISPIMTRIYSAEAIGEYTLILTAVSIFGTVICLKYDAAVVLEESENRVYALLKLSVLVTLLASLLAAVGYAVYCYVTAALTISFWEVMAWVFVLLVATGLGNILVSFNNRNKEYKLITSVNVVREVGRDVTLVGLGLLKLGSLGLLISQTVSLALGLNRQSRSLKEKKVRWSIIGVSEMKEVAVEHYKQPVYSVPANFINNLSYSALNIMVSELFGLTELAYYSMSFRMLGLPLTLVSANMSKVFFERASREYEKEGDCRKSFLMTTALLSAVAVPMVALLLWLAPGLFSIFFGSEWVAAGRYVQILAPMFGIRMVVSALTPAMSIFRKQNIELLVQVLFLVSSVIIYLFAGVNMGIAEFLIWISAAYSVIYIFYYIIMLILCRKGEKNG